MMRLPGWWDDHEDEMTKRVRCKMTMRTRWPQGWDDQGQDVFLHWCVMLWDYHDDETNRMMRWQGWDDQEDMTMRMRWLGGWNNYEDETTMMTDDKLCLHCVETRQDDKLFLHFVMLWDDHNNKMMMTMNQLVGWYDHEDKMTMRTRWQTNYFYTLHYVKDELYDFLDVYPHWWIISPVLSAHGARAY